MTTLDIIGSIIGLLYVVSEYRASRWFWPLSLLMAAFYAVINLHIGWYANTTICVYNFAMSIYGLLMWRGIVGSRSNAAANERPITSCPLRLWPLLLAATAVLTLLLWWLLGLLGEGNNPFLDGLSAALGIVGMWMLSQKYWQQWLFWLVSEPILVYIYLASGYPASAAMYAVYEVFCILGILHWRRQALKHSPTQSPKQ